MLINIKIILRICNQQWLLVKTLYSTPYCV